MGKHEMKPANNFKTLNRKYDLYAPLLLTSTFSSQYLFESKFSLKFKFPRCTCLIIYLINKLNKMKLIKKSRFTQSLISCGESDLCEIRSVNVYFCSVSRVCFGPPTWKDRALWPEGFGFHAWDRMTLLSLSYENDSNILLRIIAH